MKRRTFLKSIGFGAGMSFVGLAYGFESSFLDISRERLIVPGLRHEVKIVAVSDLHLPCLSFSSQDLVDAVNRESPDVFILAGDMIDVRRGEDRISIFSRVKAGNKVAVPYHPQGKRPLREGMVRRERPENVCNERRRNGCGAHENRV